MAQLNYDSFLPPSMTMCLRGRIFISRLGAAQASNLTGEVSEEFSAQRDEFSSAKLWVLPSPTKVDPIRLRRTMRDRPPFGFRRALMLTRLLIIAEKLLMYCSKKSPQLYFNRLLHTLSNWLPTYNQWNHVGKSLEAQTNWWLFHFRTKTHANWEIAAGTEKMGALVTHGDKDSLPNSSHFDVHILVPNVKCEATFSTENAKKQMKMNLP